MKTILKLVVCPKCGKRPKPGIGKSGRVYRCDCGQTVFNMTGQPGGGKPPTNAA